MPAKGATKKEGAELSEVDRSRQKQLKEAAAADEVLREQTRTETEERPYLDTEGSD